MTRGESIKTTRGKCIFSILAFMTAIAALLVLTACGQAQVYEQSYELYHADVYPDGDDLHYGDDDYDYDYITSETDENALDSDEQDQDQGQEPQVIPASLNLSPEDFLYDFDYLMAMLKENAPYFGLIYRRNGVDMLALIPELRARVEDEAHRLSILSFHNLLRDEFFNHAWPVTHLWFESYVFLRDHGFNEHFDNLEGMRRFSHSFHSTPPSPRRPRTTIETTIIEEGRIAYISVETFNNNITPELTQQIDDFYREIEDFEHLIIDLRWNPGGWMSFFEDLIISPLLTEPLRATYYHFIRGGEHNLEHMRNFGFIFNRPFSLEALDRLFSDADISYEVIGDLSMMDYYLRETWAVLPSHPARQIQFNGQVWILTNGHMTSGSHMAAAFYRDTGFATLVGETTAGMYMHRHLWSNYVQLPHTGLVVRMDVTYVLDSNGRPVDYGIDPHYFNLPGMNALETVLELIRQGR